MQLLCNSYLYSVVLVLRYEYVIRRQSPTLTYSGVGSCEKTACAAYVRLGSATKSRKNKHLRPHLQSRLRPLHRGKKMDVDSEPSQALLSCLDRELSQAASISTEKKDKMGGAAWIEVLALAQRAGLVFQEALAID